MDPRGLGIAALVATVGCAPSPGAVVTAPAAPQVSGARAVAPASPPGPDGPKACGQSWSLEDVVAPEACVLVVCASDVRREPVAPGAMSRALDPALDVARQRVCACAAGMRAPAFVDLVVTAVPEEGQARVEASEPDEALDREVAGPFVACVGKLAATFPRFDAGACGAAPKTTYVYSLDVELGR